jgi:hypothetical protein
VSIDEQKDHVNHPGTLIVFDNNNNNNNQNEIVLKLGSTLEDVDKQN